MRLTKEQLETIYNLANQKLTTGEISKITGINHKTVYGRLKAKNLITLPPSTKKIEQIKFEQLWSEGKTDEEIASYFKVGVTTIKTYRTKGKNAGKFNVIRYFSQTEQKLSEIQEQMILGSLLGDMSCSKRTKNARLNLVQGIKQKEYFMEKVNILGEFMGAYKHSVQKQDKRTGKCYEQMRGDSKQHPVFTEIYNLVYPDGKKTVTKEWLDKITHPIALAYWFMDDGTFNGTLATNSFSEKEVDMLIKWLKNYWNINSIKSVNSNSFVIRITEDSRKNFDNLISPFFVNCLKYKLKYKNAKSV